MKRIYLDNSSSTPVDKEVLKEMLPYFSEKYGNPSSLHFFGQEAQDTLDVARKRVATALNASPEEIIFTGSATEANNLAMSGIINNHVSRKPHIITSQFEHESVLEPIKHLQSAGIADVTFLPVSGDGFVSLAALESELRAETVLVSIMYVNNEVGTIQPISEIAKIIDKHNSKLTAKSYNLPAGRHGLKALFHTDAAQAVNFLDCDVKKLGVDMLTISGHKIYGPKGIGSLFVKAGTRMMPIILGSSQEFGLRSGTENVPSIAGLGKALEMAVGKRETSAKEIGRLRDKLKDGIVQNIPEANINGSLKNRIPHNLNVSFLGVSKEDLLIKLDIEGVAVSGGAACYSKAHKISHVLAAMGIPKDQERGSIRITLGKYITDEEIDRTIEILKTSVAELRK